MHLEGLESSPIRSSLPEHVFNQEDTSRVHYSGPRGSHNLNPLEPNFGAEFPCIFPLLHLSINQWSSLFNIDDQLFVVVM